MLFRRDLAGDIAGRIFAAVQRVNRFAVGAIEQENKSLLAILCQGLHLLAVVVERDQNWRSGEIPVPDIVMHSLEMPYALARLGIEGKQAVSEQVIAKAVSTVEIEGSRTSRDINDSGVPVEGHSGPVVNGAGALPGILGPSIVAELARSRNRVERPAKLTGTNFVCADVAIGRGQSLGLASAHDHQFFVD